MKLSEVGDVIYRALRCLSPIATRHPNIWACVVLATATVSLAAGTGLGYGIAGSLTIAGAEKFNISVAQSSWTSSLFLGVICGFSPIVPILRDVLSVQVIQIIGSLIGIIGFCLASLATRSWMVTFCVGFISGIGLAIPRVAGASMLRHYFKDNKLYLALSIYTLGYTFGLAVIPVFTNFLFTHFGFSLALLVMSSVPSIHLLGGLVYLVPEDEETVDHKSTAVSESVKKLIKQPKAVAFVLSGLVRKGGVASFFALFTAYFIQQSILSAQQAATVNSVFGVFSFIGVVTTMFLFNIDYNRFAVHGAVVAIYGSLFIIISQLNTMISIAVVMAIAGLHYGVQVGNLVGVSRYIAGPEDMPLLFSFELVMEGLGSFLGPQIASYLERIFGAKIGITFAGLASLLGALCIAVAFLIDCILGHTSHKKENDEEERRQLLSESYQLASSDSDAESSFE